MTPTPRQQSGRSPRSRVPARLLAGGGVVAAALFAALPLVPAGLPLGADSITHLYTIVEVDHLFRHGVLFSRWLPWQNGGLGNPRFLFYPALPYYLAEPWVLLGLAPAAALRATLAAALLAAASGCFAWCRPRHGAGAALVGATAYVLSPYVLFATYSRASFAEVAALAVAPWALWAVERWQRHPRRCWLAVSAAFLGLTILCHPITGALVLVAWALQPLGVAPTRWRGKAAGLVLALGLSAALWLPARLERTEIADVHTQSPGLDYRQNFLPLDWLVTMPGERLGPGYAPVALLLATAAVAAAARQRDKATPIFIVAACWLAFSLLAHRITRPLWESLHALVRDVQFPHRLLGPGSLLLALLAAAGARELDRAVNARRPWVARALLVSLLLGLATAAAPLRHLARLTAVPTLDLTFMVTKERQAGFRGRGYHGEFLPRAVRSLPRAWRAAPDPAQRLAVGSLPPGARLLGFRYEPLRYEVLVDSPLPWTAVWKALAFPGWRAEGNSGRLVLGATGEGLLSTRVAAGRQRVVVRFGSTPPRRWGAAIAVLASLTLLALLVAPDAGGAAREIHEEIPL